ncbi:hypothetical protein [Pseudotenacibaculum haliotis]|uniref:Uncharacterized protein n=1 Tax=Pseudotenacibaculum haliotis TaxID=1862138 RepID=A0ABW5LPV3_9FLAO
MKKQILTTCFIALLSMSCSAQLSKSEALKIARKQLRIQNCYCEITKSTRSTWKSYKQDASTIRKLEKIGLITTRSYQDTHSKLDRRTHTVIDFKGTAKARKRYGFKDTRHGFGGAKAQVIYSRGIVTKILGISLSADKNKATVLVRIDYAKTPFAELVGERHEPRNCHKRRYEEKEINLIKYDTGWRITKKKKFMGVEWPE